MWNVQPVIFEDEDEEALKAEFIRLSAENPDRTPIEIAEYVFRYAQDPSLRSAQAALIWSKDLEVLDRIRHYRLTGGDAEGEIASKKAKLKVLEAIYNDLGQKAADRIKAIELHAQIQGEIIKAVEKTIDDKTRRFPKIVYAQYPDD